MRVLILGASGMLGHKLSQVFQDRFETWATVRSSHGDYLEYGLFDLDRLLTDVDAFNFQTVVRAFEIAQPNVVVNAIGIIKQLPEGKDPIVSLTVNSVFPHRLATICQSAEIRLIQISTDCVFSGRKSMYSEDDVPDAEDLYGRSKLLGEVDGPNCLTLRTSIIGRELKTNNGLVEWFLGNRGRCVQGYTNAIWSGFPTVILAKVIADIIDRHHELSGVYHVSSDPITKYELLCLLRNTYQVPVEIERFPDVSVDRSLDSSRFRAATGYVPPLWPEMVQAMAGDTTPYEAWRRVHAS